MDLRSDRPFWLLQSRLPKPYPPLKENIGCDVLVVGGGITGALLAYYLVSAGVDTVLVDRDRCGQGSSAASTGLVLYELDTHLADLISIHGLADAQRAYRLCLEAVHGLARLARDLGAQPTFQPRKSLYFAGQPAHAKALRREFAARKKCGIHLDFLTRSDLARGFDLPHSAALVSYDAGQMDSFRFTHRLLSTAVRLGLRVYEHTHIAESHFEKHGVSLRTQRNHTIRARRITLATGYEFATDVSRKFVRLLSTYALATQPALKPNAWQREWVIWESSRPYFYLRTTPDGRFLFGGADEKFRSGRLRDRRIPQKSRGLCRQFKRLFPALAIVPFCAWAGTFAETRDGLPFIGKAPWSRHTYVALGYAGNGITFGLIAAQIIRDLFLGKRNRDARLFRFDR